MQKIIAGWDQLSKLLDGRCEVTLRRYIRQGVLPAPRRLSSHMPIWLGDELTAALAALPRETCSGREAE